MILDYNYLFDGSQSSTTGVLNGTNLTAAALGTAASTNVIDLVNARDMGIGDAPSLKLMVMVSTQFTSTGAGTLKIEAQGSTDNSAWTTYAEEPAKAISGYAAGTKIAQFDWPGVNPDTGALPRYLRLLYTTATSSFSAGAVISGIVLGRDDNRAYASGIAISN